MVLLWMKSRFLLHAQLKVSLTILCHIPKIISVNGFQIAHFLQVTKPYTSSYLWVTGQYCCLLIIYSHKIQAFDLLFTLFVWSFVLHVHAQFQIKWQPSVEPDNVIAVLYRPSSIATKLLAAAKATNFCQHDVMICILW